MKEVRSNNTGVIGKISLTRNSSDCIYICVYACICLILLLKSVLKVTSVNLAIVDQMNAIVNCFVQNIKENNFDVSFFGCFLVN